MACNDNVLMGLTWVSMLEWARCDPYILLTRFDYQIPVICSCSSFFKVIKAARITSWIIVFSRYPSEPLIMFLSSFWAFQCIKHDNYYILVAVKQFCFVLRNKSKNVWLFAVRTTIDNKNMDKYWGGCMPQISQTRLYGLLSYCRRSFGVMVEDNTFTVCIAFYILLPLFKYSTYAISVFDIESKHLYSNLI